MGVRWGRLAMLMIVSLGLILGPGAQMQPVGACEYDPYCIWDCGGNLEGPYSDADFMDFDFDLTFTVAVVDNTSPTARRSRNQRVRLAAR